MSAAMSEQRLAEILARAEAATPGPWEECFEWGANFYAFLRSSYLRGVGTLNFGDGDDADADRAFTLNARMDVPDLLAEVQRLRGELAEYEVMNPQQCPKGLHADWLADSEYTHACPWCRVAELESQVRTLAVNTVGALPMPTGTPVPTPWERAVAGLNALADAKVAFWIEPDGHISNPFGDEHIEWDQDTSRWRLVHDDEDDDSHEAKVAEYLSTPYTDDTGAAEAEALAAVDRSIAAQFPAVAAFLAEDPHDSPLHQSYATPHDLPEIPAQADRRAGL